jgi:hypothetical protein
LAISLRCKLEEEIHQLEMNLKHQEIKTEEADTLLKQMAVAPHCRYPPVMTHDGIHWVAVAKFVDDSTLVGRGGSPSEALADYDMQWLGAKGQE